MPLHRSSHRRGYTERVKVLQKQFGHRAAGVDAGLGEIWNGLVVVEDFFAGGEEFVERREEAGKFPVDKARYTQSGLIIGWSVGAG